MYLYRGDLLMAVRYGVYKAHLWTWTTPTYELSAVNIILKIDFTSNLLLKYFKSLLNILKLTFNDIENMKNRNELFFCSVNSCKMDKFVVTKLILNIKHWKGLRVDMGLF